MDHRPLFSPGLHAISETDLGNHFLSAFAGSRTRPVLIQGLRDFLASLRSIGVSFEVWLDGSFCTEKVDPNDVDLVVFGDPTVLNGLNSAQQAQLSGLFDRQSSRSRFGCDVLFAVAGDENWRSYWRGWYGFDRSERAKGIATLMVMP